MKDHSSPNNNSNSSSSLHNNKTKCDEEEGGMIYLLVIAHPDDESMFFLPTLRHFIIESQKYCDDSERVQLEILCLSNGNYDGLGLQREKELYDAVKIVEASVGKNKISDHHTKNSLHHSPVGVTVVNDPRLQDGPHEKWNPNIISQIMDQQIQKYIHRLQNDTFLNEPATKKSAISSLTIITFDKTGISNHPNHIDTYHGVCSYLNQYVMRQQNEKEPQNPKIIHAWQVVSMKNIIAKYFPLWICFHYIWNMILIPFFRKEEKFASSSTTNTSTCLTLGQNKALINNIKGGGSCTYFMFQPRLVWNAMAAHSSQFVWYRKLSVLFSCYTYINTLTTIKPISKNKQR